MFVHRAFDPPSRWHRREEWKADPISFLSSLPCSRIEGKGKESYICEYPKQYTVAGKSTSLLLFSFFTCTLLLMETPNSASIIAQFTCKVVQHSHSDIKLRKESTMDTDLIPGKDC